MLIILTSGLLAVTEQELIREVKKRINLVDQGASPDILDEFTTEGYPFAYYLITHKKIPLLANLLEKGANPTCAEGVRGTKYFLITALQYDSISAVETLLSHNAHPDRAYKNTPLLQAINALSNIGNKGNKIEIINILLKYNADPNLTIDSKDTPLMSAIRGLLSWQNNKKPINCFQKEINTKIKDHEYLIGLLLYYGADPYLKNTLGVSAFDLAHQNNLYKLTNLLEQAQERLINKLHRLLSCGKTPFPSEIALLIAQHRYAYKSSKTK